MSNNRDPGQTPTNPTTEAQTPSENTDPTSAAPTPAQENPAPTTTTTTNPVEQTAANVEENNNLQPSTLPPPITAEQRANLPPVENLPPLPQLDEVMPDFPNLPPLPPVDTENNGPPLPIPNDATPVPPIGTTPEVTTPKSTSTLESAGEAPVDTSKKDESETPKKEANEKEQANRENFQKRNKEISDAAKKEEDENNRAREAAMYRASRGDLYAPFQKLGGEVGSAAMRTADDARLAESGLHVSLDMAEGKHRVHLLVKGGTPPTIEVDDKEGHFKSGEDYEKLCERIVDFARGEMGFTSVTLDWKNMKDITEEKIDKFLAAARERGLEVTPGAQITAYMNSQQADGKWGQFKAHWGMNPDINPEERDARLTRMQQKFAAHNNAVRAARNAPLSPEQEIVKQNFNNKFADKKIEVESRDNIDLSAKGRDDYRQKYLDAAEQDVPKMMTEELNKIEGRVRRVESALSKLDDQLQHYQGIIKDPNTTAADLKAAQNSFKETNQQREILLSKLDKEMQQLNGRQEELSKLLGTKFVDIPEHDDLHKHLTSINQKSTHIRATSDSETRGDIGDIKKDFESMGPALQSALDKQIAAEANAAAEARRGMNPSG